MDEILQLIDTRHDTAGELLACLPAKHTTSAQLGYLVQRSQLRIAGYSVRRARLPEAVFASGAVLVVGLGKRRASRRRSRGGRP